MRQLRFDTKRIKESRIEFGGAITSGNKKSLRPLCTKSALHLVLKADTTRTGSIRTFQIGIAKLLIKYSTQFGIQIYKFAICGNHIHIVLRAPHRLVYRAWIRTITGRISLNFKIKWGLRPWSRVLTWGREFKTVIKYVLQNILEADGVMEYKPRANKFRKRR